MELKVNYSFTLEDQKIHVLMITHGKIAKSIPKHKHSKNSYEVHYIYGGKGTLISQGKNYDLSPQCHEDICISHADKCIMASNSRKLVIKLNSFRHIS